MKKYDIVIFGATGFTGKLICDYLLNHDESKKLNIALAARNKEKLNDIEKELFSLNETVKKYIPNQSNISKYIKDLKSINFKLWDIENQKRLSEKNNEFGDEFIKLSRNVYRYNDERAKIKLAINNALGSNIKEVKSHE